MLSVIRCSVFILALASSALFSNLVLAQSEADRAYQQARQAYDDEKFEEAMDLLQTAAETDDKNPDIFLLLGKSHYQLAEIDEAITAWKKLLALAPQHKYARQMVDTLTQQRKDVDTRIATARNLISKNLVDNAWQELSRLERLKTLSPSQEAGVRTLLGECYLLKSEPKTALEQLSRLATEYPELAKQLRPRTLLAFAELALAADDSEALSKCKAIVEEQAGSKEAAIAELAIRLNAALADNRAVEPLAAWLKENPSGPWAEFARPAVIDRIRSLLNVSKADKRIDSESPLSETDALAIRLAGEVSLLTPKRPLVNGLMSDVVKHLEAVYVAREAYAAASAGHAALEQLQLGPEATRLIASAKTQLAERQASADLRDILLDPTSDSLKAWIAAHGEHPSLAQAQRALLDAYLRQITAAGKPEPDAQLSPIMSEAIVLVGTMLVEIEKPAEAVALTQVPQNFLTNHYASRGAHNATVAGIKQLLELDGPKQVRPPLLKALIHALSDAAIQELANDAAAGRLSAGPLPGLLNEAIITCEKLRQEFPSEDGWTRQVSLASRVVGIQVPWPAKVTRPKPTHEWAMTIALPVAGSNDHNAATQGRQIFSQVAQQCAAVGQVEARRLPAKIYGNLLAVIDPQQLAWQSVLLERVKYLRTAANAEFQENAAAGRHEANDALTPSAEAALADLKSLRQARPAEATKAISELHLVLAPWAKSNRHELVIDTFEKFAEGASQNTQRGIRLHVAGLQKKRIIARDARLLDAGIKPAEQLDPVMKQALLECYELQRDVPETDPIAQQARTLRFEIVTHYGRLGYNEVVAAAIEVKGDPAIDQLDAMAELELARHKLALAQEQMNRTLGLHNGREQLTLSDEYQTAIDAFENFLQQRPQHELTESAATQLLAIAKRFESHQRYDIAVQLYRKIEKFAQGIEPLIERVQQQPHLAERAALAAADALKVDAKKKLLEEWRKQTGDAPKELSKEFTAAVEAYGRVISEYSDGPLLASALAGTKDIALKYAEIGAWDVADSVYADLQEIDLELQRPERLDFARAICTVGKVLPEHARELLKVIAQDASGYLDRSEVMLALSRWREDTGRVSGIASGVLLAGEGQAGGGGFGGGRFSDMDEERFRRAENRPGDPSEPAADPLGEEDAPADTFAQSTPQPAVPVIQSESGVSGPGPGGDDFGGTIQFDREASEREATLLAAVQRRQANMANRVAQLRDQQFQFVNSNARGVPNPSVAVLSDAEIKRREEVIDAAYVALNAITKDYPHTPTATQARGEILVLVNHWREISKWKRAADLVQRFLADHPQDRQYPTLRTETARDLLSWAATEVGKDRTKQQRLETLTERFQTARDALAAIVTDFPDDEGIQRQAQWDIAASFLTQARVVAALSPTLARGQFVRSADELLVIAEQYHDHPKIKTIPSMLWQISQELVSRGFHDEAITVWTSISVNYPLDPLARQSAMQTAQTYQNKLGQPLRAVETYVELYFATGATDASIQNTVFQIAMNLKQEKRWIEALHVLETFTNAFPTHAQAGQALSSIGDIHQTNEVWEDAIIAYERVIDEYSTGNWVKEGRWSIAACKINRSQWEDAMEAYREFATAYKDDSRVGEANRRIEVLKNLARYQRVVDEKNQSKAFDAQYQIGTIVRTELSNPVKAIIEFRKVAENWPNEHLADDALYLVGTLELSRGNTSEAREALLAVAEQYPNSPLADDALFSVGRSYEDEVAKYTEVTRSKSLADANEKAQRFAYQTSQNVRRLNRERGQAVLSELKKAGKFAEADKEVANYAARNKSFDQAAVEVIANTAKLQTATLTAQQMADRQDKINSALRKAVEVYGRASKLVSGDKADDALLRMADIFDRQLKDEEEAMAVWKAIVEQFGGTSVAEGSSWKIAQYYERKKNYVDAIDAYQNFLRSYRNSGRSGDAMIGVAENYEKLDRWVDAMDWYTNYIGKYPQGAHLQRAKEQIAWIKTYRL